MTTSLKFNLRENKKEKYLYSEVIALADILQDRTFRDLDFTELAHLYNKDNIKRSWNESPDPSIAYTNPSTSGFRDDYTTLRYPFVDWNRQWILAPTGSTSATPENIVKRNETYLKIEAKTNHNVCPNARTRPAHPLPSR